MVAALSDRRVHTSRRRDGAWIQEYEHGLPVTELRPVAGDGTTGTTVWFRPGPVVPGSGSLTEAELLQLAESRPRLRVEVSRRAG